MVHAAYSTSQQLVETAQEAARSAHGLVNLVRLVSSLDSSSVDLGLDDDGDDDGADVERAGLLAQVHRDMQSAAYARVLLDTLRKANEQSSSSSSTLDQLDRTLSQIDARYQAALSAPQPGRIHVPLVHTVSRQSAWTHSPRPAPSSIVRPGSQANERRTPSPSPQPPQPRTIIRQRKVPTLDAYLANRSAEDSKGEEAGLLPIRVRPLVQEPSQRDQLLGGRVGLGAAQLHEELGGQLADMSHRLKLNAIHFSNSLETEKALLDSSQQTLENNLTNTQSSKKTLSTVSRKSRGTTCMTLGIVVLVLVIFVWTYMLIRFT